MSRYWPLFVLHIAVAPVAMWALFGFWIWAMDGHPGEDILSPLRVVAALVGLMTVAPVWIWASEVREARERAKR